MSSSQDDQQALIRAKAATKLLLNNDLKSILREQALPISGVKATLQHRVQTRLEDLLETGEADQFRRLCRRVAPATSQASSSTPANAYMAPSYGNQYDPAYRAKNGYYGTSSAYWNSYSSLSYPRPQSSNASTKFPNTAFHEILEPLTKNMDLPVVHQNRHSVSATFTLEQRSERVNNDPSLRVLVYCTSDLDSSTPDVAFPSQIELKVNEETFQGNLRGIKKKAGTTRPADITHLVRKLPHYTNRLVITYAATDKKFFFIVNLVKKRSVEELVSRIRQGNVIPKDQVIKEMTSKANDADIVATSSVMSLKCPLSAMRMTLPCRSTLCNHNQCFDAESFLQLQEQAPQWSCPTCNKVFAFEALVVDQYVQDILRRFPKSTDQVTIEPDGTVRSGDAVEDVSRPASGIPSKRPAQDFDSDEDREIDEDEDEDADDDDVVEVTGSKPKAIKSEPSSATTPFSSNPAPVRFSHAPTATPPSTGQARRKQPEVVDLTLSSDEDDGEPPRQPFKRQSTGNGLSSSFSSSLPTLGSRPPSTAQSITTQSASRFSHPSPYANGYGTMHRPSNSTQSSFRPQDLHFGNPNTPGGNYQYSDIRSPTWSQHASYSNYSSHSPRGQH